MAQTTCPVMGNPINKELFVDHDGKRVYFCCKGCIEDFKKDPEKYMKALADAGVELEKAPE
ncbi:MAG: YHS domain-containing protein [Planctomycetota bacterium]